ncbi:hypothetical protein IT398_02770 [Candidatus Nomurabacteria bacterium]|nr:hypothetical protein [Candidatus Nomurabacteria bacterium]
MLEKISKFKVAEEQLITAINLYFMDASPVSTHTLARAAHEVLDQICAHKKLERSVVQQGLETLVRVDKKKEFLTKINEARNFFKHADKDPDSEGSIEWDPELSSHYILDAVSLYRRITNDKMPCELHSFFLWYRMKNPNMWGGTTAETEKLILEGQEILKSSKKQDVYKLLIEACALNKKSKSLI